MPANARARAESHSLINRNTRGIGTFKLLRSVACGWSKPHSGRGFTSTFSYRRALTPCSNVDARSAVVHLLGAGEAGGLRHVGRAARDGPVDLRLHVPGEGARRGSVDRDALDGGQRRSATASLSSKANPASEGSVQLAPRRGRPATISGSCLVVGLQSVASAGSRQCQDLAKQLLIDLAMRRCLQAASAKGARHLEARRRGPSGRHRPDNAGRSDRNGSQ